MLKECQQNPEWAVGKAAPQKTKIFRIVRRHFMSFYMRLPILCAAVTACLLIGVPAALQAQTTRMDFDSQYKALSLRLSSRQLDSQTLDLAHQLIATAENSLVLSLGMLQLDTTCSAFIIGRVKITYGRRLRLRAPWPYKKSSLRGKTQDWRFTSQIWLPLMKGWVRGVGRLSSMSVLLSCASRQRG